MATPPSTSVILAAPVRSAMSSTSRTLRSAPRKAASGTSPGIPGRKAQQRAAAHAQRQAAKAQRDAELKDRTINLDDARRARNEL